MKFDLRKPCKNCPFANTANRIVFACRERAEEIEESAYRHGFPCHLSAVIYEDEEGESSGYVPGRDTQHCVGAIFMLLNDGYDTWPGINNRELSVAYVDRLYDSGAIKIAFDTVEDFLTANEGRR